jgi:thiol:disulfide interchange protein
VLVVAVSFACFLLENTHNAFNVALSLSGGLCGSTIIFIFPGVMAMMISCKTAVRASEKYHSVEDLSSLLLMETDQEKEELGLSSKLGSMSSKSVSRQPSFLDNNSVFFVLGVILAMVGCMLFTTTIYIRL